MYEIFIPLFFIYLASATPFSTILEYFQFSRLIADLLNIEHRRDFLVSGKQDRRELQEDQGNHHCRCSSSPEKHQIDN